MPFKIYSQHNIPSVEPDTEFWLELGGGDRIYLKARRGKVQSDVAFVCPEGMVICSGQPDIGIRSEICLCDEDTVLERESQ